MAESALIVAESGSGKSTAIESLDPETTFIINVASKPLPFRGWKNKYTEWSKTNMKGNMYSKHKTEDIISCLEYVSANRPEIKTIVIDDWQYSYGFDYMEKANEKGYDKFTKIAQNMTAVARTPMRLRDDLIVFFLTHLEESTDSDGNRRQKAKTIGKMIDTAITLEGLFSIVLFAKVKRNPKDSSVRYVFETKNNGENTCKSPKDMFPEDEIPNDLQLVRNSMIIYNND